MVWCGSDINTTEQKRDLRIKLRGIINHMKVFEKAEQCKQYLQRRSDEKIILIVCDSVDEQVISEIHDLTQTVAVYVYCQNCEKQQQWSTTYDKVSFKMILKILIYEFFIVIR